MFQIISRSLKVTFLSLLIFTFLCGYSQERKTTKSVINKKQSSHSQNSEKSLQSRGIVTKANIQKINQFYRSLKSDIDTLNFPLEGEYSLYFSENGYASGNNEFGDISKVNYFTISEPKLITGVLIDFAHSTGDSDIEIAIWNNGGSANSPGSKIGNAFVPSATIVNDIQNNQPTFIEFEEPVLTSGNFYAGVKLPNNLGDTAVIWTNTDGNTTPATAWEQWSDNTWVRFDNSNSWALNISHAIFPIVDTTSAPPPPASIIDTLNFPLPGEFALYVIDDFEGGYVCGSNKYNDKAKANYFSNNQSLKITGLLLDFYLAKGGNPSIEVVIWNNDGVDNLPGTVLGNKNISMDEVKENITNQQLSFIEFNEPINISHSFYAGFKLPTAALDTLVVWSNEDGNTSPGIAWDKWEDNSWNPFSNSWQLDIAMGIHPIVDYTVGINSNTTVTKIGIFPNPTVGIIYLETDMVANGAEVKIYNAAGILVFESVTNSYDQDYKLDISGFEKGMYIISVTNGQDTFFNKIIKN